MCDIDIMNNMLFGSKNLKLNTIYWAVVIMDTEDILISQILRRASEECMF